MTIEELNKAKDIQKNIYAIDKTLQILSIPNPIIINRTNTNGVGFESFDEETREVLKTIIRDCLKHRKEVLEKEFEEL